jgi:Protein of unknown function (DUF3303)
MKYVVSWVTRDTGNPEEAAKRSLAAFSKWTPSPNSTFHQFVQRVDGEGGFAFVESDNPEDILRDVSKFTPWIKYEILPVIDMAAGATIGAEAIEYRDSIS